MIKASLKRTIFESVQNGKNEFGFDRISSPSGFDRLPKYNDHINILPYFSEADYFRHDYGNDTDEES